MSDKLLSSDQRTFAGREDDQASSYLAAIGVGFVHEDETARVTPETVAVLDGEALAALPSDLIDRLRQATIDAERLLAALPEGEGS